MAFCFYGISGEGRGAVLKFFNASACRIAEVRNDGTTPTGVLTDVLRDMVPADQPSSGARFEYKNIRPTDSPSRVAREVMSTAQSYGFEKEAFLTLSTQMKAAGLSNEDVQNLRRESGIDKFLASIPQP